MDPWVKALLSVAAVVVSFYVILFRAHDEAARQWAVSVTSLILGYWLKSTESPARE